MTNRLTTIFVLCLAFGFLCGFVNTVFAGAPDKSGVKPSVISLPSGAGSIEGLGESFEPQLNTGTSTYGVAISIPPGRAKLQPNVHLSYNAGLGNSFVGIGWTLDVQMISRQIDKGFPSFTDNDIFIFGGEELVPLSSVHNDWRCENESQFQRIRRLDTDDDYIYDAWEVTDKNGTRHIYGQYRGAGSRYSVITNQNPPSAAVNDFDQTYAWVLDTTIDLHGNRIEYYYLNPDLVPGSEGIVYPDKIRYSIAGDVYHEVRFEYEIRADIFEDYRAGFPRVTGYRLTGITIYSHYDSADHLVRRYEFEYDYRAEDQIEVPANALDLCVTTLKRVVQYDNSGTDNNYLPPLLFEYSSLVLDYTPLQTLDPVPSLELSDQSGNVQFADIDGDSLPDIFKTSPFDQRISLNRGARRNETTGEFDLEFSPVEIISSSSSIQLSNPSANLTDFDGDGLIDYALISSSGPFKNIDVYGNVSRFDRVDPTPAGLSATRTRRLDNAPAAVSFSDPTVRQMDLNFDKISDFVRTTPGTPLGKFYYYYSDDAGNWQTIGPVNFNNDMSGYFLQFEDNGQQNPRVHLSDMNGDRLLDLVYLEVQGSGVGATLSVHYWPYSGLGTWAEEREMSPASGDSFQIDYSDLRDVLVQDMTGDGLADITIIKGTGSTSTLTLRVNVAGSCWSVPYTRTDLPRYSPRDTYNPTTFRQADLNANGSTDLIWRNLGTTPSWDWLELMPEGKPNLLQKTDNSMGKVTEITYGNAVEDVLRAADEGWPWTTKIPIPLQVVRRIRTTCGQDIDGIEDSGPESTDQYVSELLYRDAFYDSLEQEFRGFAFAQRIDYGDDFQWNSATQSMVPASGWDQGKTATGQVSGPTLVTRFRYLTGAGDRVDNDEYPTDYSGMQFIDEITPEGGREEEILKGRQIWEEKVDPWVLHDSSNNGDFDQGCYLAVESANPEEQTRMTPDAYVYTRIRQEWTVRRLYRPTETIPLWVDQNGDAIMEPWNPDAYGEPQAVSLAPEGRFSDAVPPVPVINGSGRSVSFAFISKVETEIIEANGLLSAALGYPLRDKLITLQENDYDDYGNQITEKNYGVVGGPYDDERFTTTTFALSGQALDKWILGKPAQISITDENGIFVSEKKIYYDGDSFQGLSSGMLGDRALEHRIEAILTGNDSLPAIEEQSDRTGDPRLPPGSAINESRSEFDSFGNVITMLDPLADSGDINAGHARQIGYDPEFHTYPVSETIIIGDGKDDLSMTAEYDFGFGVVTRSIDFNEKITDYEYDSFGRPVAVIKPYDSETWPSELYEYYPADPIRNKVYSYDRSGDLTIQNTNGHSTCNMVVTRVRETSGQGGMIVAAAYADGCGHELTQITEGVTNGSWIVSSAQSYNHRQTASRKWLPYDITSGSDDSTLLYLDELWPASRPPVTALNGDTIVKSDIFFDPLGREIKTINPFETISDIGNESARTTTMTQILPLENRLFDEHDTDPTSSFYNSPLVHFNDGLGRLIQVSEIVPLNDDGTPSAQLNEWKTYYDYTLTDQLVHIRDSQNNEKWIRYDGANRKIFMNDPDRGILYYTFDLASNLLVTEDAKEQVISYTYDGVNRLLTEDYLDESYSFSFNRVYNPNEPISDTNMPDVAYHYDTAVTDLDMGDNTTATATNTKGFLAYIIDLSGEEHHSYDDRGRITWTVKRIPDMQTGDMVSYRTVYALDAADRVTELTYPDNDKVFYEYNARNLLQRIYGGQSGDIISSVAYRPSSQQEQTVYGNGIQTSKSYDPRLRMDELLTAPQSEPTNELIHYNYLFDGTSNILRIDDNRPGAVVPKDDPRRNTQIFTLDPLYRLTSAQYSFNLPGQPTQDDGSITYRYDRIGNMLAKTSDIEHVENGLSVTDIGSMSYGAASGAWNRIGRDSGDPPGPHALTGADNGTNIRSYPFDENGNMTDIDGLLCTWDFKDRLVKVENDKMTAFYVYDYTDQRITKEVIPKTDDTEYLTTSYINKFFEVREYDQPTKYVFNGDTRVAKVTGTLTDVSDRLQRLRVYTGWNLLSVAVETTDTADQLGIGNDPDIEGCFRWDSATRQYVEVGAGNSMATGTVFWLKASAEFVLCVRGDYNSDNNVYIQSEGNYLSNSKLTALSIFKNLTDIKMYSVYESKNQNWLNLYKVTIDNIDHFPLKFSPSEAFFCIPASDMFFSFSDSQNDILYYNYDHLNSTSTITNLVGTPIKIISYFPFGNIRSNQTAIYDIDVYEFNQNENDLETSLNYFQTRFLCPPLSNFISTDTYYINLEKLDENERLEFIENPQKLNLYSYTINNPTKFNDPSGQNEKANNTTKEIKECGTAVLENTKAIGIRLVGGVTYLVSSIVSIFEAIKDFGTDCIEYVKCSADAITEPQNNCTEPDFETHMVDLVETQSPETNTAIECLEAYDSISNDISNFFEEKNIFDSTSDQNNQGE